MVSHRCRVWIFGVASDLPDHGALVVEQLMCVEWPEYAKPLLALVYL